MAKNPELTIVHGNASNYSFSADIMLTDPPYELDGRELASIIDGYDVEHLVLITTMRQLMSFSRHSNWDLSFDFVIDGKMPKKSKSLQQPNYTHQTGVYLTRRGVKSKFNRARRQRSDAFEANGYWPTIFHAPRNATNVNGYAKNLDAITDLLGSFDAESVIDPFVGSGTTLIAAYELGISGVGIELDDDTFNTLKEITRFIV